MGRKLNILLSLLLSLGVQAQGSPGERLLDSLLQELSRSRPDTNKVLLLDNISYAYSSVDPHEGVRYGEQVLALSQTLKWKKGIAAANSDLGINYAALSLHAKATHHYLEALRLYKELDMKSSIAGVLANISLSYMSRSDYPNALEYAFLALGIYEELHEERTLAGIQENIGTIYLEQKDYDKAMEYYTLALAAQEHAGNKTEVARILGNIGIVQDARGDYTQALGQHLLALRTNQEAGNMNSAQINMANVGIVYCHMKEYSKALHYQLMALRISEDLGLQRDIAVNLGNLGETYFFIAADSSGTIQPDSLIPAGKTANLERAIAYLEKAVTACKELRFYGPLIEFTQFLSDAYSLAGDYKNAFGCYKEHTLFRDTVFSETNKMRLSDLEAQRELDLKDKEIIIHDKQLEIGRLEAANRRNERVLYISGILLLLVIVGIVIAWSMRKAQAHKVALSDIASIQSHEIRGPVARILGLVNVFNRNDPADPVNKEVIALIAAVSTELDETVKKIVTKTSGDAPRKDADEV